MPPSPPLPLNAWLRYDVIRRELARLDAPERGGPLRTVLEVGPGQGAVGARLAARYDYTGVDIDPASLATARARLAALGRGRLLEGELDAVLPAGSTYDLVCAFEVLEHLPDDAAALAGWVGRVRPGGHLMLSVPAFPDRYGPFDALVGHWRRYQPAGLAALLRAAGLVEVETTVYGAGLGVALETARNVVARRRGVAADARAPVIRDAAEMASRTAGSGRLLQPPAALGLATQAATAPFRRLQRRFPHHGTGLVATARHPG